MNNEDKAEVIGILANSGRQLECCFQWGVGGGVAVKNDHRDRLKNKDRKLSDMLCREAKGTSLFGFAFKTEVSVTVMKS